MIQKQKKWLLAVRTVVLLDACNVTKSVPQGDCLYTGATVKLEADSAAAKQRKVLQSDLQ